MGFRGGGLKELSFFILGCFVNVFTQSIHPAIGERPQRGSSGSFLRDWRVALTTCLGDSQPLWA